MKYVNHSLLQSTNDNLFSGEQMQSLLASFSQTNIGSYAVIKFMFLIWPRIKDSRWNLNAMK